MSEECTKSDCSGCGEEGCSQRKPGIQKLACNEKSRIGRVIGIISGKGGVGKSTVTALLANGLIAAGKKVAVLDADITGPSMPRIYGIHEKADSDGEYALPVTAANGVKLMSINLLLESETDPVIWRGPIISGTVRQFWTDVAWGDVDVMLVDMPPGTGDVALTVFQSLPVDGLVVVTSPQDLVSMIVGKAVKMAQMMQVPILGLVENMSYFRCPDCGKEHAIFGASHAEEVAKEYGIEQWTRLPIRMENAAGSDAGKGAELTEEALDALAQSILGE